MVQSKASQEHDFDAVRAELKKIMDQPGYDDGSAGPVLVRLAWHCSGTYDKESNTGGSNGATMRYAIEANDSANNGLNHARDFLEPIKQKFPWISYGDLWCLAGVEAIKHMGGPDIPIKFGRLDHTDDSDVPPNGRLPDAAKGTPHLRDIFYRMGFNDQEIVALSGAHSLGRCHGDRSGFEGPWVHTPTRFSNTYYRLLINEDWKLKTNTQGIQQYRDEEDELMMLPTDYALIGDKEMLPWVEKYADDKELFFDHFSKVFAKLIELGIQRDEEGNVLKKGRQNGKDVSIEGPKREVEAKSKL